MVPVSRSMAPRGSYGKLPKSAIFNLRGCLHDYQSGISDSSTLPFIGIGEVVTHSPPSRPGEFHPEPLTEPDVNLSIHPARATPRKPPGFRQDKEFIRLPVDSILT